MVAAVQVDDDVESEFEGKKSGQVKQEMVNSIFPDQMVSTRHQRRLLLFIIIVVILFITTWYLRSFDKNYLQLYKSVKTSYSNLGQHVVIDRYDYRIDVQKVSVFLLWWYFTLFEDIGCASLFSD